MRQHMLLQQRLPVQPWPAQSSQEAARALQLAHWPLDQTAGAALQHQRQSSRVARASLGCLHL